MARDIASPIGIASAGRRWKAQRIVFSLALVAGLAACTFEPGESPDLHTSSPPRTAPTPPLPTHQGAYESPPYERRVWGPQTPYLSVEGVPYSGDYKWPQRDRIGAFTVTRTGVVFLDPDTSEVIWEGWNHDSRTIGGQLQRLHGRPQVPSGGERLVGHRGVIGNPAHDLVAWIETADSVWDDVVVVEASTGDELARASIPVTPGRSVRIASLDVGTVYFAMLEPGNENDNTFVPSTDIRVWRWAAGEMPEASTRQDQQVADVSADIWAVVDGRTLQFEDAGGRVLSRLNSTHALGSRFGETLSPDGRFWYSAPHMEVVETATGDRRSIAATTWIDSYAWTGPADLTFVGFELSVCSAVSGQCSVPFDVPANEVCDDSRSCSVALPAH
jgi:hypothetical protein